MHGMDGTVGTVGTVTVTKQGDRVTGLHMRVLDSVLTEEELETLLRRVREERPHGVLTVERVASL